MRSLLDQRRRHRVRRRIDGLPHPIEERIVEPYLLSENVLHGLCHLPFLADRSRRPGRCLRVAPFFGLSFLPLSLIGTCPQLRADPASTGRGRRGSALLRRGPRFSSDALTASRMSTRPRSTWRRSMSTFTTCTATLSPRRYSFAVFSPRRMWARSTNL